MNLEAFRLLETLNTSISGGSVTETRNQTQSFKTASTSDGMRRLKVSDSAGGDLTVIWCEAQLPL